MLHSRRATWPARLGLDGAQGGERESSSAAVDDGGLLGIAPARPPARSNDDIVAAPSCTASPRRLTYPRSTLAPSGQSQLGQKGSWPWVRARGL